MMRKGLICSLILVAGTCGALAEPFPEDPCANLQSVPAADDGALAYCRNVSDDAADARFARKVAALRDLEQRIEERLALLERRRAEAEQWLARRQRFLDSAEESLVEIVAAMRPDAAAEQLAALDPTTAAAVIGRLPARAASTILSEMKPREGARIAAIIAGLFRSPRPVATVSSAPEADDNIPTLDPEGYR